MDKPVVIVGGERRTIKLARLRAVLAQPIEWVPVTRVRNLARRVRSGHVAGVVLLQGLVSHSEVASLTRALRAHGVPFDYAGKAGLTTTIRTVSRLTDLIHRKR